MPTFTGGNVVTFIGGNSVIATSAPTLTSIGLSIAREMGLSVATFKLTVSGQPDDRTEARIISFRLINKWKTLFISIIPLGLAAKLQLENQEDEALASRDGKLELSDWIPKDKIRNPSNIGLYLE